MGYMNRGIVVTLLLCGTAVTQAAHAQTFPNKRFTILVAGVAGGGIDLMARIFADRLRTTSSETIVVENRPGASDTIAYGALAAAPADGHTIAFGGNQIAGLFIKTLTYDPATLTPVSILSQTPYTVVASKASNLRDFREFIAFAKANPGKLNFGAASVQQTLAIHGTLSALGIVANVVPYKGFAPLETAMIAGQVDAGLFGNLGQVKNGQIVAIATAADPRHPDLPTVPTFKELGINDDPRASYTVWTRADVPPQVMARLVKECQDLVRSPEWTTRITNGLGIQPIASSHEFAVKYLANELRILKASAERTGVKPQ
jgi:tripartite-type tricarboxylate transporter receptor subunit TctC